MRLHVSDTRGGGVSSRRNQHNPFGWTAMILTALRTHSDTAYELEPKITDLYFRVYLAVCW